MRATRVRQKFTYGMAVLALLVQPFYGTATQVAGAESVEVTPAHLGLVINEVYPNPAAGEDEWVEIYNPSDKRLSLNKWRLAYGDSDDSNRYFSNVFGSSVAIEPYGFLLRYKGTTSTSLHNENGRLQLKAPSGEVADDFTYNGTDRGQSFARDGDGNEQYTTTPSPTPGRSNGGVVVPPAALEQNTICSSGCEFTTLHEAASGASAGDVLTIKEDQMLTSEVTFTQPVTVTAEAGRTIFVQGVSAGVVASSALTLRDVTFEKTDSVDTQAIVKIQAEGVVIDNATFKGLWQPGDSAVSSGIKVEANNFTIKNSRFSNLQQAARINGFSGVVQKNYVTASDGWVVSGNSVVDFTQNTWGENVVDIAIIGNDASVEPVSNNYTCERIARIKTENNNPKIEHELIDCSVPATPEKGVPDSAHRASYDFSFSWNRTSGAAEYEFQASQSAEVDRYTGVLLSPEKTVTGIVGTQLTSPLEKQGTWYWQVRAVSDSGIKGEWSRSYRVMIDTDAPSGFSLKFDNNKPVQNTVVTGNQRVTFKQDELYPKRIYIEYMQKNANGDWQKITGKEVKNLNQATLDFAVLGEGERQIKISTEDNSGRKTGTTAQFYADSTRPALTVKPESVRVGEGDTYESISFKLSDNRAVVGVYVNNEYKSLSPNRWSDLNGVEIGKFGGEEGGNVVYAVDAAGNRSLEYRFTLVAPDSPVTINPDETGDDDSGSNTGTDEEGENSTENGSGENLGGDAPSNPLNPNPGNASLAPDAANEIESSGDEFNVNEGREQQLPFDVQPAFLTPINPLTRIAVRAATVSTAGTTPFVADSTAEVLGETNRPSDDETNDTREVLGSSEAAVDDNDAAPDSSFSWGWLLLIIGVIAAIVSWLLLARRRSDDGELPARRLK